LENFTNETIDTTKLPRFEEVTFTPLHPKYWNVVLITIALVFLIIGIGMVAAIISVEETPAKTFILMYVIAVTAVVFFSRIAFRKKGFAFRNHDVLFRSGIIATSTIVIPYNRIQHVALHEGLFSRYFGLAEVQIFTAGGSSSDIQIPGIEKSQAEDIKQLLMGKIQKQL
jgi:membrane protein YdbS with pleckstrin-like domain